MSNFAAKGAWVEIHSKVLPAGERAPQVPQDTQRVPLVMRAKGFLLQAAQVGDDVEIETCAGRHLSGTLVIINPPYTHTFGPPIDELITIGNEVRAILRERSQSQ
ncbi:MAG: 2-amino-4-ketopentanoate thiolase [Gammaproteobacteria bacterium]|jgi:hypothetical protein|nr:2-amino-4-ketopentanoate thiolase [Gammaproteobacteria bacterium]